MMDRCILRVALVDGSYRVVDQDGRTVANVREVNINAQIGTAAEVTMSFIPAMPDGKAIRQ